EIELGEPRRGEDDLARVRDAHLVVADVDEGLVRHRFTLAGPPSRRKALTREGGRRDDGGAARAGDPSVERCDYCDRAIAMMRRISMYSHATVTMMPKPPSQPYWRGAPLRTPCWIESKSSTSEYAAMMTTSTPMRMPSGMPKIFSL